MFGSGMSQLKNRVCTFRGRRDLKPFESAPRSVVFGCVCVCVCMCVCVCVCLFVCVEEQAYRFSTFAPPLSVGGGDVVLLTWGCSEVAMAE